MFDRFSRFQIDARRDVLQRIHRQPGMNRFCSVSCQQRKVMNFSRRPGADDQAGAGTQTLSDQVMMHPGRGEQRRNRYARRTHPGIGKNQDIHTLLHGALCSPAQRLHCRLHAIRAFLDRVGNVQYAAVELAIAELFYSDEPREIVVLEHWLGDLEAITDGRFMRTEKIGLRADKGNQRHHQLFAYRVDGRIGDLCEQLLEVVV